MKKLIVGIGSGGNDYITLIKKINLNITVVSFEDLVKEHNLYALDLIIFTGGEDVGPALYGQDMGSRTSCNTKRDKLECDIFSKYKNTPKLGICRGAQFLTVMSGGSLIQHVENHTASHSISVRQNIWEGEVIATSTHHQMMYPFNLRKKDYDLIAWSTNFLSGVYLGSADKDVNIKSNFLEPEIVYYPKSNSLCIQGHPEFLKASENFKSLTLRLIKSYLLNNK